MRVVFFFLPLLLFACKPEAKVEEAYASTRIDFQPASAQTFTIRQDTVTNLRGEQGSVLKVPANAFVLENGSAPVGEVQLELKEVFSKSDMMANGLSTTSDGRLIESTGMVFIGASSAGKILKLRKDKQIWLSIPNKEGFADADFFQGSFTEQGFMNWELLEVQSDTIVVKHETIIPLPYGRDCVFVEYYQQVGDQIFRFKDSTYMTNDEAILLARLNADTAAAGSPAIFHSSIKNLGWINCDRFLEIEKPTELIVRFKDADFRQLAYLVFHDRNSILELYFENGEAVSGSLPSGDHVTLMVMDKKGEKHYFHKQSIILGEHNQVEVQLKRVDLATLQQEVKKIDQEKEKI
ncbi:hypothetical protein D770_04900 [Flammeovirgaceae bacterium 311]|nr:hypothetical protein D770_04900 [Flammeovirgaceae bacterium 311]